MLNYRTLTICVLVAIAATYNSTRSSLFTVSSRVSESALTGEAIWVPSCNTTAAYAHLFCFDAGVFAGLSPYAIITTLFWISPILLLALGGIAEHIGNGSESKVEEMTKTISDEQSAHALGVFKFIWTLLSFIWFVNPFCAMVSTEFYQHSAIRFFLAFVLASSYPLSWSLMLVSLPMTSVTGCSSLLGLTKYHRREAHIFMATWTALWVMIHGVGEIIYLIATKTLWSSLAVGKDGENLVFLFGVIPLVVSLLHGIMAVFRNGWYSVFRKVHLPGAFILLLLSTLHWSPFSFFLLPAATAHAFEMAKKWKGSWAAGGGLWDSIALLSASLGSLVGLCATWASRASYMEEANANRYIPFVFAGASITLSFVGALVSACIVFAVAKLFRGDSTV